MANRLANETSPYLLQHSDNPVDWYPWGEEALAKAREEDKPILLSVGYSSCHWCHVMERESFEDAATAELMNEHFVNIKVDREERPDIDSLYMQAVQAMTRSGGWPMTVFLTPDGTPFYGGTYFPPRQYGGMPAFAQLLRFISDAYENRRDEVDESAGQVREFLHSAAEAAMPEAQDGGAKLFENAAKSLLSESDAKLGGFGGAPKFPQPMNVEVLLRYYWRTGDEYALTAVNATLTAMARGGIYDQIGGGFSRYSTDERWLVPHFEKMLYDNALLARLYLEAYQATGEQMYLRTAEETLEYLVRDMRSPEGGFYSAEDADSEGVEGKFYVWTPQELREALGEEDARLAAAYWGVTEGGNFEGKNILNIPRASEAVAAEMSLPPEDLEPRIAEIRRKLLAERGERVRPERDEKVLAAWNGLALRAFALAARVTGSEEYGRVAGELASFLLEKMRVGGRLRRSYKDGEARIDGYLEDYAAVADGLIALYEATFEARWLAEARDLADAMLELFWDSGRGAFYDTAVDHEELVTRPRDIYDTAAPSGNSMATDVLLRLALLTDREDYRRVAETVLEDLAGGMEKLPAGFGRLLAALDFSTARVYEIAFIGETGSEELRSLARPVDARYLPNAVIAGGAPDDSEAASLVPLLQDREAREGRAKAYLCEGYVCQSPTTDPGDLARQLENA
ncbi:MAG: thioredoxin domain-containing protein [Rubrobacter sp.]|nr:thioredoxin domain-containing protein [Rubrobacter sp.]